MSEVINMIESLDPDERFEKAKRHFYDAFLYRKINNNIDVEKNSYCK